MTAKKQAQALQMLIDDHKEVRSLHARFEKLGEADAEEKQGIIDRVCAMLTAHAQLEEEIFYPAVKDHIQAPSLIAEAYVEHQTAKDLIARLQTEKLDDEERDAVFTVLHEYVNRHVQEEEKELFPQIRKADVDLDALADEMDERRAQLMGELEGEQDEDKVPSRTKKRAGSSDRSPQPAAARSAAKR